MSETARPVAAPGQWRQHVHKESVRNTGSLKAWSEMTTGRPRGTGWAPWGGGEVRSTAEAGYSGGGKGPQFKTDAIRREGPWRLGNLSTPINGQKLQKALHAKA